MPSDLNRWRGTHTCRQFAELMNQDATDLKSSLESRHHKISILLLWYISNNQWFHLNLCMKINWCNQSRRHSSRVLWLYSVVTGHLLTEKLIRFHNLISKTIWNGISLFYLKSYVLKMVYSIRVSGWLLKSLNLITAPSSVSDQPGSVTWLATMQPENACSQLEKSHWKITTLWLQNISFWPKINIAYSYFTMLMLNCLQNTL